MADLLPSSSDASEPVRDEPRVVGIDSDDAEDLLSALSSETARDILASLHEDPASPARIADRVDTTLQNAQYHLERMETAGVIQVADTAYSEKGREMDVYAPTDRALVVVAGTEDDTAGLQSILSKLLGGVGVLGIASVALDRLLRTPGGPLGFSAQSGEDAGAAEPSVSLNATVTESAADGGSATTATEETGKTAAEATRTATEAPTTVAEATQTPQPTADEATRIVAETTAQAAGGPDPIAAIAGSPGTLFFLGGVTILIAWAVWTYRR